MAQKLGQPIAAILIDWKGSTSDVFAVSSTSSGKTDEQTAVFWKRQMSQVFRVLYYKKQFSWAGHLVHMPSSRLPKKILYGKLTNGDVTKGGNENALRIARNTTSNRAVSTPWTRSSWPMTGPAVHTGVAHSEQQRKEHSERLRLARKERQQDAKAVPTSTEPTRPVCQNLLFPNRTV